MAFRRRRNSQNNRIDGKVLRILVNLNRTLVQLLRLIECVAFGINQFSRMIQSENDLNEKFIRISENSNEAKINLLVQCMGK